MESMIVITVLIMACIFCVIGLGEISKLTKENKDLQKTLEAEQQLRETEADRYELIIEAKASRIKEEVAKRQEAERKLRESIPVTQTERLIPYEWKATRRWDNKKDTLNRCTRETVEDVENELLIKAVEVLRNKIVHSDSVRYNDTTFYLGFYTRA